MSTNDEKRASAPEVLVEELLGVYRAEVGRPIEAHMTELPGPRSGIRAVLSHLARRGAEGLPSCEDMANAMGLLDEHDAFYAERAVEANEALVAPLLAARNVALAEARAEIKGLHERAHAAEQALDDSNALVEALRARAEAAEKARDAAKKEKHDAADEAQRIVLRLEKERAGLAQRLAAVMALPADWRAMVDVSNASFHYKDAISQAAKWLEKALRDDVPSGAEAPTGATT